MVSDSFQKIFAKIKPDSRSAGRELAVPAEDRTTADYLALAIGSCGGVGYMPIVPATWGSMVGVGIYLLAQRLSESFTIWADGRQISPVLLESARSSITLAFLIGLFLIGIWAATRVEKLTGKKDPGIVVIDEVVGQLVTFLFIPARLGWWTVLIGFLAFRAFDILKPYPTARFESLPEGLGAMADDAMAGFYAAAFMSVLCSFYLTVFH